MNTFFSVSALLFSILSSNAQAAEIRISSTNLDSYSLGEMVDCNPNSEWQGWGFETTLILKNKEKITARTCLDGPVGYRKSRESAVKNLSRIVNDETSFEKNASQIVCFKTYATIDTVSHVIIYDHSLVKCP